ncbi:MAG: hypothetical protein ACI4LP_07160 [Anaerovoracaceae bacterium]
MAYDTTGMTYNWVSDIIRVKTEPRVMQKDFISPKTIKDANLYKDSLLTWMENLEKEFIANSADSQYVSVIKDLRNDIDEILEKYRAGNVGAAYEKMKSIVSVLMSETTGIAVSSVQNSVAFNDIENVLSGSIGDSQIEFFRARTSEKHCVFSREEMLHIPFDMRSIVSSARFSIPGLPCLYLATTTYCCWLELRTPPDHQFNVSPVRINQKSKILNLTMTADMFEQIVQYTEIKKIANKHTLEALKLWMLSYASSYKVNADNRSFKEEYIIPQLIMLVSRDLGLEGVSYYSKQVEDDRFAHMLSVNLALFAKYNGEKKFSEICRDVEIAPSYNYAMFKQLGYSEKYKSQSVELHIKNTRYPKMIGGFSRQNEYQFTEFYDFDRYLFSHIAPEMKKVDLAEANK